MSRNKREHPTRFQTLTCVRQTGTKRDPDGTIHYSFVGEIHPDLPALRVILTITPALAISTAAAFDEQARSKLNTIQQEEDYPVQVTLLNAS